jgi:hypothetical protein
MRIQLLALALAVFALMQAGCASSFRAGGPRTGVEAGAAVGPTNPSPVIIREESSSRFPSP